jgi:hypothetical protein
MIPTAAQSAFSGPVPPISAAANAAIAIEIAVAPAASETQQIAADDTGRLGPSVAVVFVSMLMSCVGSVTLALRGTLESRR